MTGGGGEEGGKGGKMEGEGESGREREGWMSHIVLRLMMLDIVNREDAYNCTYTLNFELLDLTLSKGGGGGEGDGELGSNSDAAMHLLRPVLDTFLLCSIGLIVIHKY